LEIFNMATRRGLFAAMEELDGSAEGVDSTTPYGDGIAEAEVAARDEEAEIREDAKEADQLFDTVDEGIDDTETLDEIGGSLGEAADKEVGVDEVGIAPVIIATEALCRSLGIENVSILPAVESFGSSNSRVAATRMAQVAIEGIVDDAWKRIKAGAEKAWEMVLSFIDKLVHAATTTQRMYAKSLLKAIEGLKGDPSKHPEPIKSKVIVRAFGEPGTQHVDVARIKKVLGDHAGITELMSEFPGLANRFKSEVLDAGAKKKTAAEVNTLYGDFIKREMAKMIATKLGPKDLINGTKVVFDSEKNDGSPDYKDLWKGKEVGAEATAVVGSKGDLIEIMKKALSVLDSNVQIKKDVEKTKTAMKESAGVLAKGATENEKEVHRALGTSYSKFFTVMGILAKRMSGYQYEAAKHAFTYCKLSYKELASAHKEKPAEKTD
jgi:hypothetical protein